LNDPQILRLAEKVTLVSDEQATKAIRSDPSNVLTTLDVHALGKTHSIKVDIPKGDPRNPMTEQERKDKFRRLASIVLESNSVEEIMRNVENLEKRNANDLSRLLAANSSPHI
jgi:2-methylcitrate dehydratase